MVTLRRLLAPALLASALLAAPQPAAAQTVPAEVVVVLAKEQAGQIDPALANMPALRRPPFNAFRTMTRIPPAAARAGAISLTIGQPTDVRLPNGRTLKVELMQIMPNGRFRVRVSINRPNQNDNYLPLLQVVAAPGDPFFVAGQAHQGGTLIVGIRVGATPPPAPAAAGQ